MTQWLYDPANGCVCGDIDEPCTQAPTLALDVSSESNEEPWTIVVPVCADGYDGAHRGGFTEARPIAQYADAPVVGA